MRHRVMLKDRHDLALISAAFRQSELTNLFIGQFFGAMPPDFLTVLVPDYPLVRQVIQLYLDILSRISTSNPVIVRKERDVPIGFDFAPKAKPAQVMVYPIHEPLPTILLGIVAAQIGIESGVGLPTSLSIPPPIAFALGFHRPGQA